MADCLIVDDSEAMRDVAGRLLTGLGHSVRQAAGPDATLDACEEGMPEVLLLDWDLPAMGALDVLRAAADFPVDKRPVIILCATENDARQFALARAAGAPYHVLKPFDRESLRDVMRRAGFEERAVA
ncbi:response regulator [Parvularcula dongshanensis]|uniref:Two-component system chemotaxis response regulator CheY n=1 Tax=Parvularcula dongshanensis TaxID=1173995 RepID=A0A840I442_9PROT|nr:response regulator [Parvularcula dongshanensis]MBB4658938.1 two-component system chemotaxis response regulator CheY [Parvularcula dongshanensis]